MWTSGHRAAGWQAGSPIRTLAVAGATVLIVALPLGCGRRTGQGARPVLRLYSGAGLRPAVAELVDVFQSSHDVAIECDYGGSNMIFGRLKVARRGDIFIPGDVRYVKMAEKEGLIAHYSIACYFVPVILVAKGNPKHIISVADLLRPDVKLGLGDSKACAIGKVSRRIFQKNGIDPADVESHVAFRSLTVNELGLQITAGKLDAAIVWGATAHQYADRADVVRIPAEKNVISVVPVAVLTCSEHPDLATAFERFATSEEGKKIWAKHGYTVNPPEGFTAPSSESLLSTAGDQR